jgi:2-keto-4-pentenoate hydratase/2-oxohepta-3-ene-1,7-dioic acid hydratase in catechol pathway
MKIICVDNIQNCYYLKPDSALLLRNRPYYIPDATNDLRVQFSPVAKITRLGKCISTKFANNYYDEIAIGAIFTPIDLLEDLKHKQLSWEEATDWDNTAAVSDFVKKDVFQSSIKFSLNHRNHQICVNFENWQEKLATVIENISKNMTLRTGDLIYFDLSPISDKINIGDKIVVNAQELEVEVEFK